MNGRCFIEQGLALGYRYYIDKLGLNLLEWLAALAGTPSAALQSLKTAFADIAHPAVLDVQVRLLLRAFHTSARFYDQQIDYSGTSVQQVPEADAAPGVEALSTLFGFLAPIAEALRDTIAPLSTALASPTEMDALLRREGWRPPVNGDWFAALSAALALASDASTSPAPPRSHRGHPVH